MLLPLIKYAVTTVSVLLIITVMLQPSQRTGLIGDTTDAERRVKRGFELFLYRLTVIFIILLIGLSILFSTIQSGILNYL